MADYLEGSEGAFDAQDSHPQFGLLRIAWRRKALIALGLVIGLVVGAFYFTQSAPVYQSTAQLLVTKKSPIVTSSGSSVVDATAFEDYLSTNMELIKSPKIVQGAVSKIINKEWMKKQGIEDLSWTGRYNTATIIGGLTVTGGAKDPSGRTSNIFNIALRGPTSFETEVVLKAVIESYRSFLRDMSNRTAEEISTILLDFETRIKGIVDKAKKEHVEFREQHPDFIPGLNLPKDNLLKITSEVGTLENQVKDIEAHLKALEQAKKEGKVKEVLLAMIDRWSPRTGPGPVRPYASNLEEQVLALRIEERRLLGEGLAADHPKVKDVRDRIHLVQEYQRGSNPKAVDVQVDPVDTHIEILQMQLNLDSNALKRKTAEKKEEEAAARKNEDLQARDKLFLNEVSNIEVIQKEVASRLQGVDVTKLSTGYEAEPLSNPELGVQVAPKAILIFMIAAVLGLVAGSGLAYVAELADKSFRTPEEIRFRLGLPVVGHIPAFPPCAEASGTKLDPSLCAHFRSKSAEAEAYRAVRTALYFSTHGATHKVIQITSPTVSDGKTTLAANLAISIAQSGKRTLLIDADFRKPRIHKLFGVASKAGLASVITGEAELNAAIQPSGLPGLWILPSGPIPPNPAELLTSPRFKEILDLIRTQYDFILVDSPPLLVVTDPCVVAPRVDGVLLTLRLSKSARPQAVRAKEILGALQATVFGIVVNAVTQSSGGYGYDYRYGYYKHYGNDEKEADSAEQLTKTNIQ